MITGTLVLILVVLAGLLFQLLRPDRGYRLPQDDLIRLHVVANSNSTEDQALKLKVRDAVIEDLRGVLGGRDDPRETESAIRARLGEIERRAEETVEREGYSYQARAEFGSFSFPTKESGGVVLPAGRYEALRVIIGSGRGNNWWCILFPPFCLGELGGGVEKLPVAGPDSAPGAEVSSGGVSSGWEYQAQTGSPVAIQEWDGTVPPDAVAA
ncbi:MAG: stage II sporulation protein R, partial [Firmicutes bacterium]|nr:stage II sporulation protein R [Bacillota bacterium]